MAAHEPETEWELEKRLEEDRQSIDALEEEWQSTAAEEQALAEQVDEIDSAKKRQKILDGGAAPGTASLPASPGNESSPGSPSSFSPYSDGDADEGPQPSEAECLQTAESLLWLVLPLLRIQQELQPTPSSPTSASSSSSNATLVFGQAARRRRVCRLGLDQETSEHDGGC